MNRRLVWLAVACTALLSSERSARAADPTTADCLAASDASLKSGNQHKLRSERAQLLTCAAPSCPTDIRKECLARVDEVNAQIPTIIFQVKDPSGAYLTAVKVTMDGDVIAERLEGTALSIDPGEHAFTFETQGQPPVTVKLMITESQKERRESITVGKPLVPGPVAPAPVAEPANTGPSPTEAEPPSAVAKHGMGTQEIVGISVAAAGLVGVVVGGIFGGLTAAAISSQKSNCASSTDCPNYAQAASDHATWGTDGTVSTAAFIAGGALMAGGAALFFTARKKTDSGSDSTSRLVFAPSFAQGGPRFSLQGSF